MTAQNFTIIFGGWYQRTTLHLSEIYGFLSQGYSKLNLSKEKLENLRKPLNLEGVTREAGDLEYVKATTKEGIEIRYYEDGLYILELNSSDIKKGQEILENYFNNSFNPAIAYIFSLGAPTPKILANIKTIHPVVVGTILNQSTQFKVNSQEFGVVYSQISSEGITVYKTDDYIFVVTKEQEKCKARDLMEMQIFFREFKDQLEKYLNIHRNLWEEISQIKEKHVIRGREIVDIRARLDGYQKTINLINSRINQMNTYIHTRASIAKGLMLEKQLIDLFQYKFEILSDTHSYIKEIWKMTSDYLQTAIDIIKDIQERSLNNTIKSIQVLASIGVVSGILDYLTVNKLPGITSIGLVYFLVLILVVWLANIIINWTYRNLRYKISFPENTQKMQ